MLNKPQTGKRSVHVPKGAVRMAMCDAKMAINGCQVFLGHPDPARAQMAAKMFKGQLGDMIKRAKALNVNDMYNTHLSVCERISKGETIKEIFE